MITDPEKYVEVDGNGIGWEVTIRYAGHSHACDHTDVTTKVQIPPVITNYACRACKHDQFEAIFHNPDSLTLHLQQLGPNTMIGQRRPPFETHLVKIVDYRCPNCTVHFENPTKWSDNQPPEVIPPIATEKRSVVAPSVVLSEEQLQRLHEATKTLVEEQQKEKKN